MEVHDSSNSRQDQLFAIASVAVFRSLPIEKYRLNLKHHLKEFVRSESTTSGHDDDILWSQTSTFWVEKFELPWKELCQHHDMNEATNSNRNLSCVDNGTTPLQECMTILLDQSIIPRAQAIAIVNILLSALLDSPRRIFPTIGGMRNTKTATRWTPSQMLFLHSIVKMWNTCPSLNHSFFTSCVPALLDSQKHKSPHKWNRLVSAACFLATECPPAYATMVQFILEILYRVEGMEPDSIRIQEQTENKTQVIEPPRRKKARIATLDDLHERDLSSTTKYHRQPIQLSQRSSGGVSLKEVLSSRIRPMNGTQYQQNELCDPSRPIHHEWVVVQTRAYKKFYNLFRKPPSRVRGGLATLTNGRFLWSRESCSFDIHTLLTVIRQHHSSASLRLCLIGVNDSIVQCLCVCRIVWGYFLSSKDIIWLRIYCEIIVSWSRLDDRRSCWEAMMPLVMYIEKVKDDGMDNDADEGEDVEVAVVEDEEGSLYQHRPIFQCLAHILSRRSRLLEMKDDDVRQQFHRFIKHLELHCGELDVWFSPSSHKEGGTGNMTSEIATLQRLGIIGLTSLTFDDEDGDNHDEVYETSTCEEEVDDGIKENESRVDIGREDKALIQWPFSSGYDVRSAYDRLGKTKGRSIFHDWDTMLTSQHLVVVNEMEEDSLSEQSQDCLPSGPPMTDYIHHSDLLRQIFSFCVYQDLIQCQFVCQNWKSMIDSSNILWRDVYMGQFPIHLADPRWNESKWNQQNWKVLFITKVLNERNLFHRRNQSTGYKHRTCPFIGCNHVLKSQRFEEIHIASHLTVDVKDSPTGSTTCTRTRGTRTTKKKGDSNTNATNKPSRRRNNKREREPTERNERETLAPSATSSK